MGVRYTNRAITTEQQIDILKERGLLIDDVERAVKALDIISYFRLAGYWRHFEADHTTHQFREGCRFADIIDLYSFDKQLRALLFTAIQTIEVAVRTKIIKHFALEFGAFWFMDENFATNEARFATNLAVIRKEVERSHDDFITEHFRKYNEPELPPVWKTLEAISMGTLSKLYSNFSNATAKHAVAREFGLNHHKFLRSWLESVSYTHLDVYKRQKLHRARIGIDRGIPYNSSFTFYSKYDIFFCQTAHITAIIRHFGHYYDKIRTVCHQLLSFRIHIHTQLRAAA